MSTIRFGQHVFAAIRITLLASLAGAANACASACNGTETPSTLSFSATVAIPDASVNSLTIAVCLDGNCVSTVNGDASTKPATVVDAGSGGPAIQYTLYNDFASLGQLTLTQVSAGSYLVQGNTELNVPPGSVAAGHATISFSGGVSIQMTALAGCTTGTNGCTTQIPWEQCTVQFE